MSFHNRHQGGWTVPYTDKYHSFSNNNHARLLAGVGLPNYDILRTYRQHLGPDGRTLRCSESTHSSSPASDESARYLHLDLHDVLSPRKAGSLGENKRIVSQLIVPVPPKKTYHDRKWLSSNSSPPIPSTNNTHLKATLFHQQGARRPVVTPSDSHNANSERRRSEGHGAGVEGRMNTNGVDRSGMTGCRTTTSDNLTWLADVCQAQATQRPSPAIHTSIAGAHDPHFMLPGSAVGGLYRTSLTLPESSARIFSSGQFGSVYTTTGTTLSPYTSATLYAHGHSQQMASMPPSYAYYPQYQPHRYSGGTAFLPTHLSPLGTYSAVLANLGTQHAESQLPRAPFLHTQLPRQYPSAALTPTDSPGSSSLHQALRPGQPLTPTQSITPGHGLMEAAHQKSPKVESKDSSAARVRVVPTSPPREGFRSMQLSPSHPHYKMTASKTSPTQELRKAGKEGFPKHMSYPGRPPDSPADVYPEAQSRGQPLKTDEPCTKRARPETGNPPPLQPVHPSSSTPTSPSTPQPSILPPPPPLQPARYPNATPQPHYPPHFMKGSIIQLANGDLKRVEDLRTDDFVNSADISADLKIDSSTVVRIEERPERATAILGFSVGEQRIQVTVEATLEHPFFVFGRGWSSCSPERTLQRYGLQCHKLIVGDVCISLTHKVAGTQSAAAVGPQPSGHISSRSHQISVPPTRRDVSSYQHTLGQPPPGHYHVHQSAREGAPHTLGAEVTPQDASTRRSTPAQSVVQPRKRRWSAPDHIGFDTPAGGVATSRGGDAGDPDRDGSPGPAPPVKTEPEEQPPPM